MSFLFPWAWWGLLAAPLLVAFYLLRRRHRPLPVGALFLWQSPKLKTGGGRRLSRLEHALLLLLELLLVVLLVLAAVGPGCRWQRRVHRVAVVLDDSASMGARVGLDAKSAAEAAGDWLQAELYAHRPFECAVIASGNPPRLASTSLTHLKDVAATLQDWHPRQPTHDLGAALRLARQAVGENGHVLLLTDHAPAEETAPPGVHVRAFGQPCGNVGITAATRESDPVANRETLVVEAATYGPVTGNRTLECRHGDRLLARRELPPSDAGSGFCEFRETFEWNGILAGAVEIRLVGDDALAEDDRALLLPENRAPVRVQTAFADARPDLARLFAQTINALGGTVVGVTSRPHLLIVDDPSQIPAPQPNAPPAWTLLITDDGDDVRRHFGPYVLAKRHPLCQYLDLTGLRWAASPSGLGEGEFVPLISSADMPLLGEFPGLGEAREFRMSFQPDGSNLQHSPAWPVLIHNLVRARRAALPGFLSPNLRAGQEAVYRAAPEAGTEERHVSVSEMAAGQERLVQQGRFRGRTWSFSSPVAGLFAASFGGQEDAREWIAFQFACPEESDLRLAAAGEWGRPDAFAQLAGTTWRDDAWMFLLAALAVGFLHLYAGTRPSGA